ncbi:hypothetical protein SKAU_G00292710 [Synaphobranchus kaupii]|uniref:Uncharacterized protein n=1 Tax=Synaphobranchus kaupii TaxID=118154 RepID=A0A9Q1EU40_SYNKA|nr:hypothetical protein SKAU_G00292710 [Synaphobranchus kaupii]
MNMFDEIVGGGGRREIWFKDTIANTVGHRTTELALELRNRTFNRTITKSMMRKLTIDKMVSNRESNIKNFVSFITRDSIQKSLRMYMESLRKRKV